MPMLERSRALALPVLACAALLAACGAAAAETIVGQETEKYFFRDGKFEKYDGQFEYTYLLEADTLTRTRIYDIHEKRVVPDETVYRVQRQLQSDPVNAARHSLRPALKAVGQPDADSIETVIVEKDTVITAKATGDYLIVAKCKRIK